MASIFRRGGKLVLAVVLASTMAFSTTKNVYAQEIEQSTSYRTVTEVFDWGPATTKVIVDLGKKVDKGSVNTDTFRVHVARAENRTNTTILGDKEGDRKITKVYVSDKDGNAVASGDYVVIEMEVGPDVSIASPINYSLTTSFNGWVKCDYTIAQQKDISSESGTISGLVINTYAGDIKPIVDNFKLAQATYDNVTLKYSNYAPTKDNAKHPLVVWLHGAGEGGTDGLLPIMGNKADNFASKEVQAYFGGAYVLAPQTPTFWMDGVNGFGDGTSKYENALMSLIKDYVANNRDIDTSRIYIGGDSNGGYMTMLMARDYTDYFAAAFPTCEALKDTLIKDSDIEKMKNIPIWFTAAKTDTTVPVNDYVVPTYNRLVKAGAKNVHLSLFDNVVDTTGIYKKADGSPYEYMGHWSWIYVYNNQCMDTINGKRTTIMEWLAAQAKVQPTNYTTVTEVEDWRPAITKVIVNLGQKVDQGLIATDTFKVHVLRTENRPNTQISGVSEGERKVVRAYVSDKDGNSVPSGNYAVLEMEIGPDISLGSPINYSVTSGLNGWITSNYTITQQRDITTNNQIIRGLVGNVFAGGTNGLLDKFTTSQATYTNVTLHYSSFAPSKDNKKHPLIIWLHGGGEGGTDGIMPIAGNKAVNFASNDLQAYFNGAYVLAPQAPTYWMDGINGKADGTSKYEAALMSLIKEYVANNPDIDTSKIYIGGDSNGGYMTLLMARDYTDYFAAAFPTCEGLKDTLISDSDIQKLKNLPIWFTAAKTDNVLPPAIYAVPTYDRLIKAGAKDIHFSFFDKVLDTTGLYKKVDGTPYEYNGHWSWIYVYNNQCIDTISGKSTTIMEWLASKAISKATPIIPTNTTNTTTQSPTTSVPTQTPTTKTTPSSASQSSAALSSTASPQTGDTAPIVLLSILMLASLVGGGVLLRKKQ
ncbi:prolyl oligopeptidase family serine peptidase [Clostridium sp. C8-1-8]|uniref:prolyl oligopeptidase family serine peptidase n=1 Tax=Clostridium sp. C8-1-8 TaxID=2698831 RepID=UPI0013691466|nr:prolyl oligopeptidase family serine peptidase [Clostridium sp. C8-1-8]